MTKNEFYDSFEKSLSEFIKDKGFISQRIHMPKINEPGYEGLSVRIDDNTASPVIDLDSLYLSFCRGETVESLAKKISLRLDHFSLDGVRASDLSDPDFVIPRLYCSVIDAAGNENVLKTCPHELIADLAVIPRCRITDSASFLVTNDQMHSLRLSGEEIMAQAHMNDHKQGYSCRGITEVIRELMKDEEISGEMSEGLPVAEDPDSMYVLSKNSGMDGASAVTDRSFLRSVHDRLGEDFYILPSSRHEVLAIPYSHSPGIDELKEMVRSVNLNEVDPSDKLSDQVYFFNGRSFGLAESIQPVQEEACRTGCELSETVTNARSR